METVKLVTAAQMRQIEQSSVEAGVSLDELMENAGLAVAEFVRSELEAMGEDDNAHVVILVGPGNNGADGFVAGRHLAKWGIEVRAVLCASRKSPDPKRELAEEAGVVVVDGTVESEFEEIRDDFSAADVILDAVLGTGASRPIGEPLSSLIGAAIEAEVTVIALDLPTGLDSDTGKFDSNGLPAEVTLMLGNPKLGPTVEGGSAPTGTRTVLDIGIPYGLDSQIKTELLTADLATFIHPNRPADGHKGTFGSTLIVGGSKDYLGAVTMATDAATRSGVGLTFVATPEPAYALVAGDVPEAMYRSLPVNENGELDPTAAARTAIELSSQATSVVIGPGLGQSPATHEFLSTLLSKIDNNKPLVIDADALNILSGSHKWWERLDNPAILTPHPGEMARLLGITTEEVLNDRLGVALEAAKKFNKIIVLKGAATLIATPDERLRVSHWVNPGLAKGGSGDVLAGLMGGLVAQSPDDLFDMASLAVFVHGYAAYIARKLMGETGMRASDVSTHLGAFYRDVLEMEE